MGATGGTQPISRPTGGAFGRVVEGLDLAREHPEATWAWLRAELERHRLLIVPGQSFDDDRHVAIAARFGRIAAEGLAAPRTVGFVSNHRADGVLGPDAASFHIDYGFFPEPYEYLSLYGLEVPASGTQTVFVDAVLAASTLPAELRARLAGCSARHVLDPSAPGGSASVRVRLGRVEHPVAHQVRPVLWPHRLTGAEILGVWEQQTDAILPLAPADSTALILELFAHLYAPAHRYEHRWQPGDFVIWDNHGVQHGRPEVGTAARRTLRRVCIGATQDLSIFANAKAAMVTAGAPTPDPRPDGADACPR